MDKFAFFMAHACSCLHSVLTTGRKMGLHFLFLADVASAQLLFVDTVQYVPADIVMDFFNGTCVDVTSVEFLGKPKQLAFFEGSQSGVGVNATNEQEAPKLHIYPTQFSDELVIDPTDANLTGELVLTEYYRTGHFAAFLFRTNRVAYRDLSERNLLVECPCFR